MKFFLSCEAQAGAAGLLSQCNRIAARALEKLESYDYGSELTEIDIITILVQDELYQDGGYKERSLFKRKHQCADIRLQMDYRKFLAATPEQRYNLYCKHIVKSIETLYKKVSSGFQYDRLVNDVKVVLYDAQIRIDFLNIKRFP